MNVVLMFRPYVVCLLEIRRLKYIKENKYCDITFISIEILKVGSGVGFTILFILY